MSERRSPDARFDAFVQREGTVNLPRHSAFGDVRECLCRQTDEESLPGGVSTVIDAVKLSRSEEDDAFGAPRDYARAKTVVRLSQHKRCCGRRVMSQPSVEDEASAKNPSVNNLKPIHKAARDGNIQEVKVNIYRIL